MEPAGADRALKASEMDAFAGRLSDARRSRQQDGLRSASSLAIQRRHHARCAWAAAYWWRYGEERSHVLDVSETAGVNLQHGGTLDR
jgi:hypothetical protein